ncbi:n-acetylglutamate synthase [Seminavis robusta]|uniref:N-acetylglutamate synthase n=1 Tax=Seminavis robusta TaxID=568900 RepID=A0A9N8EZI9_9STRA|nr:n-acetylglutamate synthase [Seminavis robusta]|eukprot:Sro2022_g311480.1 n-acetylglutamate synthase (153) ;mRNA; f:4441-4899
MSDIRYAPPAGSDLVVIKELLESCQLPTKDLTESHLTSFLVATTNDNGIIGVVGLEVFPPSPHALLRSLAVKDSHRGQGIATALYNQMEKVARETHGIKHLYLLTTTAADYFRSRQGFQRVERKAAPNVIQATAEFSAICPCSAVCLRKDLS